MDEVKDKEKDKREGYHHFVEASEFPEQDEKESVRRQTIEYLTTINNYKNLFASNELLSEFPFAIFEREEQYSFAKQIQQQGTGAMLSAASNIREKGDTKTDICVEWDEDAIENVLRVVADVSDNEARAKQLQVLNDLYAEAIGLFHSKLFPAALDSMQFDECVQLFQMTANSLRLTLAPKYPDAILYYARYVENCIRSIFAIGFSLAPKNSSNDIVHAIERICSQVLTNYDVACNDRAKKLGLKNAFYHFLLYLKYREPLLMERNVKNIVSAKVKEELSAWERTKLKYYSDFNRAIREGFETVGVKIAGEKIQTVKNLFIQLNGRFVFMMPQDSATWAALCYVCYKCNAKKFPVQISRKRNTCSAGGINYSNGSVPKSISSFAKELSALESGNVLKNDMRLNYLVQIIKNTYMAAHNWNDDEANGMETSIDRVNDVVCRILRLYDAKMEATLLSELLDQIWQCFLNVVVDTECQASQ